MFSHFCLKLKKRFSILSSSFFFFSVQRNVTKFLSVVITPAVQYACGEQRWMEYSFNKGLITRTLSRSKSNTSNMYTLDGTDLILLRVIGYGLQMTD